MVFALDGPRQLIARALGSWKTTVASQIEPKMKETLNTRLLRVHLHFVTVRQKKILSFVAHGLRLFRRH